MGILSRNSKSIITTIMAPTYSSSSYRLAAILALASSALAQTSVYVPGDVDELPGASISVVATGVDGFTTYDISGVTLAENAQSAVMTEYGTLGATAYACQLGADAMATCQVSQYYDGAAYAYTEPIAYFTGLGAEAGPAGPATTTAAPTTALPTTTAAPTTAAPASTAAVTTASSAPTSAPSSSSSSRNNGPAAGAVQPTSANVFTGAAASSQSRITAGAAAIIAGLAALILA